MSAQTTQDFSGMLAQLPGYLPELPAWICDEEGHLLQSHPNSSGGPESAFFEGLLHRFKDFSWTLLSGKQNLKYRPDLNWEIKGRLYFRAASCGFRTGTTLFFR